jgi:hypothetical protein
MTYKATNMKKILGFSLVMTLVMMMASCGNSSKEKKGDLGDKKVELEKKKKEKDKLDADIRTLEEEIAKAVEEANNRSINEALRKAQPDEKRSLGLVQKIECKGPAITYQVRLGETALALTSKDFQNLIVTSYASGADSVNIGCGADISSLFALLTYKDPPTAKPGLKGQLIAIDFVPKTFRLLTDEELNAPKKDTAVSRKDFEPADSVRPSAEPPPRMLTRSSSDLPPDVEQKMREAVLNNIRSNIREPATGEKREMAFLQKIECTNKGVFFNMKTSTSILRLLNPKPESLPIRVFTPDLGGVQLECNASIMDFPAIVIYSDKPDNKAKTAGTILSLDFVPKTFTLN